MSQPGRGSRFGLKPVSSRHYDALSRIDWRAFERLIADYYRDQGFVVDHSGTGASSRIGFDGGIDLKLRKGAEYVLVQCKHENVYKVTHNPVHELLGVMANQGASRAILITSGEFTGLLLEHKIATSMDGRGAWRDKKAIHIDFSADRFRNPSGAGRTFICKIITANLGMEVDLSPDDIREFVNKLY